MTVASRFATLRVRALDGNEIGEGMRILAAVVTHNRRDLLRRCLDKLRAQARAPDGILVIDNASSDGTPAMLQEQRIDHVTQPNLGSAGGWQRAVSEGLQRGYDWIWLMDDDGYPDPMALRHLSESAVSGVACVSSIVVREDDPRRFVFPVPVLDRHGFPALFRVPRKLTHVAGLARRTTGHLYPFVHLFNGALISAAAVARVGNIDERYFIYGEEVDYFCRLRSAGRVVSDLRSLHYHPDVSSRPLSPMKTYYYVKNSVIVHKRYFNQPALRNLGVPVMAVLRVGLRNGMADALSYVFGAHRAVLSQAIARGRALKVGRDFDDALA